MHSGAKLGVANGGTAATADHTRVGSLSWGPGILLRIALFATAVTYLRTITYGFVFDDLIQIEMNPSIQSWRHWHTFFTGDVWSFGRSLVPGNYYRPVFLLWLTANFSVFKLTPGWWHLAIVAAHLVATALVYSFASRLLRNRPTGALAALLFGVHPLHIESVA